MTIAPCQQAQRHSSHLAVTPGLVQGAEQVATLLGVQLLQLGTQFKQFTGGQEYRGQSLHLVIKIL